MGATVVVRKAEHGRARIWWVWANDGCAVVVRNAESSGVVSWVTAGAHSKAPAVSVVLTAGVCV